MARVFERGLTKPSGYVLPIQRWQSQAASGPRWRSEKWKTRRGKLFLVPGDSPVGYRLPLGTLPHVPPSQYPYIVPVDPSLPRGPLPAHDALAHEPAPAELEGADEMARRQATASFTAATGGQDRVEQELGEIGGAVRTALSVEPRDGRLCVFMPPVEALEDYLELIAAAENAARKTGLPVHIEGYGRRTTRASTSSASRPIPASSRSTSIRHRTGRIAWRRPRRSTRRRGRPRLGADKFMIDGRHTGTGGGNHVVVGGATPQRQPLPAPARPAEEPGALLAAAPGAVLPVLRPVHRPDQPGAAHRRGAPRQPLRAGNRHGAGAASGHRRGTAAVAGRPAVPQSAGRRHRQHAPLRNLHRQAVLAGRTDRPARPRRVPRLRDAAQCAHEPCPAIAGARHHRAPLAEPDRRPLHPLGHLAARPLHAAALCLGRFPRRARRPEAERLRVPSRMVRCAARVPLPVLRRGRLCRRASSSCARRWSPGT